MQCLPAKSFKRRTGLGSQPARLGLEAGAVGLIAEDRMPDMGKMHPNLVGTAGLQGASEQAGDRVQVGSIKAFQRLPVSNRRAAAVAHSLFVAGVRMTAERGVDCT